MLVLTRKPDAGDQSKITVGGDIEVTVLSIHGDQVRIGVDAPRDTPVNRKEIWLEKAAEDRKEAKP